MQVNTSMAIEATAYAQGAHNAISYISNITYQNQTASDVVFQWYLEGNLLHRSISDLRRNISISSIRHHFSSPGRYQFCVNVSNVFSRAAACWVTEGLVPIQGLEFVALFNGNQIMNSSVVSMQQIVYVKFLITAGSRVSFLYDFGDGRGYVEVTDNNGTYESDYVCATASHEYKACGNYTMNVTVVNEVSQQTLNLPGGIVVESEINKRQVVFVKPSHVYLEHGVSKEQTFKVHKAGGCNVLFTWNFGDGTDNITTGEFWYLVDV